MKATTVATRPCPPSLLNKAQLLLLHIYVSVTMSRISYYMYMSNI